MMRKNVLPLTEIVKLYKKSLRSLKVKTFRLSTIELLTSKACYEFSDPHFQSPAHAITIPYQFSLCTTAITACYYMALIRTQRFANRHSLTIFMVTYTVKF